MSGKWRVLIFMALLPLISGFSIPGPSTSVLGAISKASLDLKPRMPGARVCRSRQACVAVRSSSSGSEASGAKLEEGKKTRRIREAPKVEEPKGLKGLVMKGLLFLREIYGQLFVLIMDTLITKPFMMLLNRLRIENHRNLVKVMAPRNRGAKQGLVTVSNHCSMLDEPLIISALIPWPVLQWQLRWSLCNDSTYFALGPIFAQLFYACNRGLPIWRNRSINQPMFRLFCDKARAGGWCHIFPEGRTWQPWKLRGEGRVLGPLRPGVGKLIAHASEDGVTPIVLPIYHTGMHRVLPQFPNKKKIAFPPKTGNDIVIRVGEPIDMQDLIDEYKPKRLQARKDLDIKDPWTTTPADEELYDAITARVEKSLTDLGEEVDLEKEWQLHPSVLGPQARAA